MDLFILETFADLEEIHQAILGVRDASDLPIIAQMVIREDGRTTFGSDAQLIAERLTEWGADVVGLNCSVGPNAMLNAADRLLGSTDHPVSMQPNAGLPREVDGRTMYMASPEYMASYAARMIRKGVRFVGGCCGTTPEHIAAMAGAVRMLAPASEPRITVSAEDGGGAAPRDAVPLAERSAWGAKLAAGEFLTTVEIVPPRGREPGGHAGRRAAAQGGGRGRGERAGRPPGAVADGRAGRRPCSSSSGWGSRPWSTTAAATATCWGCCRTCWARRRWAFATCC